MSKRWYMQYVMMVLYYNEKLLWMHFIYTYFCLLVVSVLDDCFFVHFSRLQSPSNISTLVKFGIFPSCSNAIRISPEHFNMHQTLRGRDSLVVVFFLLLLSAFLLGCWCCWLKLIRTASTFLGISLLWNWKEEAKICKIKTLSFVALSETKRNWKTSVVFVVLSS